MRWATFDKARELIRLSSNADGRDRDLAILEAAEKSFATIPYKEHARVQPQDWNELQEMSRRHTVLNPTISYTAREIENIKRGFFPTVMDQKWFLYFTGERLRMHRSWTGILIYDLGFAFDSAGGAVVTDVIATRDPGNTNNDDEEDLILLDEMIREHLLEPLDKPAVDGFVTAMALALKPKYLGSPDVISDLIGEFINVAIRAAKNEATSEDVQSVAATVIAAFTDDDAGYTLMPSWHSAEQIGVSVRNYLCSRGMPQLVQSLPKTARAI